MTTTIIGDSKPLKEMLKLIDRVAPSKTNVLIIGESGTGKELVARMLHEKGPIKNKPFIPVNCGAIPENLIESEMFGHKRGSFTGAVSDKVGLFEAADGGTLFLDEVGELPLPMQVKLLRALQERIIRRVGSNEDTKVDVRIIAATNRDLEAAIRKGTFREDLYYRLNVILIKTPPLRERKGDLVALIAHFLKKYADRVGRNPPPTFDAEAMTILLNFGWPGNIRELENIVERAVTLSSTPVISPSVFPSALQDSMKFVGATTSVSYSSAQPHSTATHEIADEVRLPAPDFSKGNIDLDAILLQAEKVYILRALEAAGGVKKKAAGLLGITFRSMRYRLAKLGFGEDGESED